MYIGTLTLLLAALAVPAAEQEKTHPGIPDTPAGRVLQAWVDAFNSGDPARIQDYLTKHEPGKSLDGTVDFRDRTGGFELLGIGESDRLHIEFRVREKASPTTAVGKIEVKDTDPAVVISFSLRALPRGMIAADSEPKIDAATRDRVIDEAIAVLSEFYVFADTAKKMEQALRVRQNNGEYEGSIHGESFAELLTNHLQEVSHDKHLRVLFAPMAAPKTESSKSEPAPQGEPAPSSEASAQMRAQLERNNCFFEKLERLPSNIGYLKFNAFPEPEVCGPTAMAAMNFLGNVDALIYDLRDNGGGSPDMIAFLSTYLFSERTHLNDLYNRKEDSTTQYWTLPFVPGKRLAGKPVFVLTSNRTFSGAEEFSYNLKNLKRATIVGESTGGGAHPVSAHRVGDHFMISVPFARAINPITKTNWEGTGVEPDVKVPASEALDVAKKLAAEQIRKDRLKKE